MNIDPFYWHGVTSLLLMPVAVELAESAKRSLKAGNIFLGLYQLLLMAVVGLGVVLAMAMAVKGSI